MKKNVAGQKVGAQMVSATDGSAFTGSVTVSVTGDAGTQATGSVGSGACTHEGNGYHTYAPAQAETNYELVAFTFTGSGAIPQTLQVYTSFPQTGDAFTTATNVETDTQDIQSRLPAALVGGRIDANVGAISADSVAADNAEAFFDGTGYAGTNNVIPTVTTATNVTTVNGLAANVITAASMAADASAEIADAVWDEDATAHQTTGTFGQAIGDPGADTNTIYKAVVTDATGATVGVDVAAVLDDTGTAGVVVASLGAGVITAASIAADAITDAKVASDVTIASVTGSVGSVTGNVGGNVVGSVGSVTGAVGSVTGNVGGNVTGSVGSLATQAKADVNAEVVDALTVDVLADSVATDGSRPTLGQAALGIYRFLMERSVSGTTLTVKKEDGSTASMTFTLNDATAPTSITRAS